MAWAVVVAQLVERSLPIPEVHGSNPVIGKNYLYSTFVSCQLCIENNEKEAGDGPFFFLKKVVQGYSKSSDLKTIPIREKLVVGSITITMTSANNLFVQNYS